MAPPGARETGPSYHETAEHRALTPHPSEGNLGRTDLYLGVGLVMSVVPDWTISAGSKSEVDDDGD